MEYGFQLRCRLQFQLGCYHSRYLGSEGGIYRLTLRRIHAHSANYRCLSRNMFGSQTSEIGSCAYLFDQSTQEFGLSNFGFNFDFRWLTVHSER